jgi:hypothetical protein
LLLLFARKEDIQYATEKGAEGLRVYIQNKGSQISSEATEVVAKDSFGAGIATNIFPSFLKKKLDNNVSKKL